MKQEQRAIFNSKPIARKRWFASILNWRELQLERIVFTDEQIAEWNVPQSGIITYYITRDLKFNRYSTSLASFTAATDACRLDLAIKSCYTDS